jgi:hypothetical protein
MSSAKFQMELKSCWEKAIYSFLSILVVYGPAGLERSKTIDNPPSFLRLPSPLAEESTTLFQLANFLCSIKA